MRVAATMPMNADYHYLLKQEANFNKKKPDHIKAP